MLKRRVGYERSEGQGRRYMDEKSLFLLHTLSAKTKLVTLSGEASILKKQATPLYR
jgi:hypothetical protein